MIYHKVFEKGDEKSSGVPHLFSTLTKSLSAAHLQYIFHWNRLIDMENNAGATSEQHIAWTSSGHSRNGGSLVNMQIKDISKLSSIQSSNNVSDTNKNIDSFLITFSFCKDMIVDPETNNSDIDGMALHDVYGESFDRSIFEAGCRVTLTADICKRMKGALKQSEHSYCDVVHKSKKDREHEMVMDIEDCVSTSHGVERIEKWEGKNLHRNISNVKPHVLEGEVVSVSRHEIQVKAKTISKLLLR